MNLFALFMLLIVGVAAVMAVVLIGSQHSQPIVDTYGATMSNETNQSQATAGNLTATGTQVGTGAVLLVGGIISAVVIGALILLATRKHY